MNIREGARRMQRSGRAMVILALSAFALGAIAAVVYAFLPSYMHVIEVFGIVLPLLLTVIWVCAVAIGAGTLLWVAGWILDGFHNE
ncbi:MAG TPA: hypothetical protein VMU71_00330 [Terracidiphilus sp.]|nr:hypothetical protein [Terracidiphilus sp.]